jgi:hypothetical protein
MLELHDLTEFQRCTMFVETVQMYSKEPVDITSIISSYKKSTIKVLNNIGCILADDRSVFYLVSCSGKYLDKDVLRMYKDIIDGKKVLTNRRELLQVIGDTVEDGVIFRSSKITRYLDV